MKNYMERDKFFYAAPKLFPKWPYRSRLAIGVSLKDFWARRKSFYNFIIKKDKNHMYRISSSKAKFFGTKYKLPYGSLPNIIPLEEFKKIVVKPVEKEVAGPVQTSLL